MLELILAMSKSETDGRGFDILESTQGDRVRVNQEEYEVTRKIHLRDTDTDDYTDDIYGVSMKKENTRYRIYVHPASMENHNWISEIYLWAGRVLKEPVEEFNRLDEGTNQRVSRERYKEMWSQDG
ncbi:hypothetical protein GCM10009037_03330 [Halarchaeum grantii]|uniref:Uncharacterized protein n=1 Tax=Halarchaeum grantii TaxID=1193105 RepID=A0A830F5P8_9EURY|nr:hypothetical protein [Halarchaeum grantii]GGL23191.1 hypothetical protein GCM10009037_03330 [Halarchaeum grantii]